MADDADSFIATAAAPVESRPGIFLIGPPNVGKRTILSRLLSVDFNDELDSSTGILCHGWTINTKYYRADVSIWTAHLDDEFSLGMLPNVDKLAALVMVFDLNNLLSFNALQTWVTAIDIQRFDILLCIGNKADLLPGHIAHEEYRQRLQNCGKLSVDPHHDSLDYGIYKLEGSSLLGFEEPSWQISRSCLEWCLNHNIEYVEACASNADFDKCLSLNGDMQGIDRLFAALTTHMWPGMILKSGDRVPESFSGEKTVSDISEEESEFELEYEILSGGSAEPWDDNDDSWAAFMDSRAGTSYQEASNGLDLSLNKNGEHDINNEPSCQEETNGLDHSPNRNGGKDITNELDPENLFPEITSSSVVFTGNHAEINTDASIEKTSVATDENHGQYLEESCMNHTHKSPESSEETSKITSREEFELEAFRIDEVSDGMRLAYDDLEHLMSEISGVRDNLRLMPDFQRREAAANLAMKMAAMFGFSSDEEGFE